MMHIVQIDNWQEYLRDGEQFLKTARNAYLKKKKAFSNDTLYNLTCMAIEKLIMAFLMKNGDLAENHTMKDLLRALQLHLGENTRITDNLMYLDTFQEICDLDSFSLQTPDSDDVTRFITIGEEIQKYLLPHFQELPQEISVP